MYRRKIYQFYRLDLPWGQGLREFVKIILSNAQGQSFLPLSYFYPTFVFMSCFEMNNNVNLLIFLESQRLILFTESVEDVGANAPVGINVIKAKFLALMAI